MKRLFGVIGLLGAGWGALGAWLAAAGAINPRLDLVIAWGEYSCTSETGYSPCLQNSIGLSGVYLALCLVPVLVTQWLMPLRWRTLGTLVANSLVVCMLFNWISDFEFSLFFDAEQYATPGGRIDLIEAAVLVFGWWLITAAVVFGLRICTDRSREKRASSEFTSEKRTDIKR